MKTVLILCTGNYYRSRYAEIVFNWRAAQVDLQWRADSRGLDPDPRNIGPMSRDTIAALAERGIPYDEYLRLPIVASEADFVAADYCVAVKEAEHRPLIERNFPQWLDVVEFWQVHDLDCCGPEVAIPHLNQEIESLLERLRDGA